MKRYLAALLAAALLAGCAQREAVPRAEALQRRYAELETYRASVTVELPRGEEVLRYVLSVEGADGGARVTVREPAMLEGVSAVWTDDTAELSYDGMTLDGLSLSPGVSAMNCVPLAVSAAAHGFLTAEGREKLGDTEAARLELELAHAGETLGFLLWFGPDDALLYAEIVEDEKIILAARFTNFAFGDILTDTKE